MLEGILEARIVKMVLEAASEHDKQIIMAISK
jgi:hypothetical protein